MLNWIRGLFTRMDRSDAAAERLAVALEDMAADMEAARDALRQRLGIEATPASTTTPATTNGEPLAVIEATRNGHSKRKTTSV